MSPQLLENLNRMLGGSQPLKEAARMTRLDHIGARADLQRGDRRVSGAAEVLDWLIRWRFRK